MDGAEQPPGVGREGTAPLRHDSERRRGRAVVAGGKTGHAEQVERFLVAGVEAERRHEFALGAGVVSPLGGDTAQRRVRGGPQAAAHRRPLVGRQRRRRQRGIQQPQGRARAPLGQGLFALFGGQVGHHHQQRHVLGQEAQRPLAPGERARTIA